MIRKLEWQKKLTPALREVAIQKKQDEFYRLIIELPKRRKNDRLFSIIENYQGKVHREIKLVPSVVVEIPVASFQELARSRYVFKIWNDLRVHTLLDIAVPTVGGKVLQDRGYTGSGVVVAVIDTGIYPHPDLVLPQNRILAWNDLVNKKKSPYDDNGHGTHVSGIVAGNGNTSQGKYKGMAPEAKLVGVKVLDGDGSGNISTVIAGIEWCLENQSALNIRVINMSMGTTAQESYKNDPLCRATTAAWEKGIVVCVAAGNEGPQTKTIDAPGINPNIITVGNADDSQTLGAEDDVLNQTSSRGPTIDNLAKPDLVAPGTMIMSTWINGGYKALTGTSMSTPLVTGGVAQIIQAEPSITPDRVKKLLKSKARSLGLGPDLQGAGELDLAGIFPALTVKKVRMSGFSKLITCQLCKKLLTKSAISSSLISKKIDEFMEKAFLDILGTPK